jgi:hypothetical protein
MAMNWLACLVPALALSAFASPARAQATESSPMLTAGLSAGVMRFRSGLQREVLSGALQYRPTSWLTVGAAPTAVRVAPAGGAAYAGVGDLPVTVGVSKPLAGAPAFSLGAGLVASLPVGNRSNDIGSREVGWAMDLAAGFAPRDRFLFYGSVSRDLAGARGGGAILSVRYTSLGADAALGLSGRFTATASLAADAARSDSLAPLVRTAGVGFTLRLVRDLQLIVDGGLGVNQDSPRWLLSIGVGTAYSGLSPVGLNNPGQRLKTTFGRGPAKLKSDLRAKRGS